MNTIPPTPHVALRHRGFWMPLALLFGAAAAALAVALGASLAGGLGTARAAGAASSTGGATTTPVVDGGMERAAILDALRSDRTWYWHWERRNKDKPFKFVVGPDDGITKSTEPDSKWSLERRWVLLHDGHLFALTDGQNLKGFFIRTGRQAGAYTDEKAKPATKEKPGF